MNLEDPTKSSGEIPPTTEEIAFAASVLSRLEPDFLPLDIFLETSRLRVSSILEVVPLRTGENGTEVLLLTRPEDDPNWPGMLHTPGTALRPPDVKGGLKQAIGRIFDDELGISQASEPVEVGVDFHQVNRGTELAVVYFSDLSGQETPNGTWYPADELPDNIVDTQLDFISRAVSEFKRNGAQQ